MKIFFAVMICLCVLGVSGVYFYNYKVQENCAILATKDTGVSGTLDTIYNTGTATPEWETVNTSYNEYTYPTWNHVYKTCVAEKGNLRSALDFSGI